MGFRRISFGIQDADPEVQRAVNRVVEADQLQRVMAWMREADFDSVNVDLICGLPLQTPERFHRTLELVRELRPDRISLFSFAYLPSQLPLQRRINADDLPSPRQRLQMLDQAHSLFSGHGYASIGMDHYALETDSLAIAARQGQLHRNFQGYTTGGELELLGVGPTAISQFDHLYCQNHRDLKAYAAAVEAGRLPVERGVVVRDPDVLERRAMIREVMCHFQLTFDRERFTLEWQDLKGLEADGLVRLGSSGSDGSLLVTEQGRWLIRTIAAVFDPAQRQRSSGARLI
jgi:oxygen-independent coproporphyrinogen-3 oxidase